MISLDHPFPGPGTAAAVLPAPSASGLAVLNISLDAQIARGEAAGQETLGDPVD